MTERPILFSAPMVRAILAGRKVQTRRVLKPQPSEHHWSALADNPRARYEHRVAIADTTDGLCARSSHMLAVGDESPREDGVQWTRCPFGRVGDRLWVRETWARRLDEDHLSPSQLDPKRDTWYWADPQTCNTGCAGAAGKRRPSIFMPRKFSRIVLEVTGIRVQRLQDISAEDAIAEGIQIARCGCESCARSAGMCTADQGAAIQEFWYLWDSLNAKRGYGWDVNPYVWALTFRRVQP